MQTLTLTVYPKTPGSAEGFNLSLDGKPMAITEILKSGYRFTADDHAMMHIEAGKFALDTWMHKALMSHAEHMTGINLRDIIHHQIDLTEDEREGLVQLLCKGCRTPKWNRIRSIIYYDMLGLPSAAILERVKFNPILNKWSYTAGQSYSEEIRYIRDNIVYSA